MVLILSNEGTPLGISYTEHILLQVRTGKDAKCSAVLGPIRCHSAAQRTRMIRGEVAGSDLYWVVG